LQTLKAKNSVAISMDFNGKNLIPKDFYNPNWIASIF
jgi:hypothetical protein